MNPTTIAIIVGIFIVMKFVLNRSTLKSADAKKMIENGGKIIDVRSASEFKGGHYKKAINIQHTNISAGIKKEKISKETPIILYCASGARASAALSVLKADGYTNVQNAGNQSKLEKLLS